jgi:hypothetical protein
MNISLTKQEEVAGANTIDLFAVLVSSKKINSIRRICNAYKKSSFRNNGRFDRHAGGLPALCWSIPFMGQLSLGAHQQSIHLEVG